jgi:hypothetical protein
MIHTSITKTCRTPNNMRSLLLLLCAFAAVCDGQTRLPIVQGVPLTFKGESLSVVASSRLSPTFVAKHLGRV